MLGNNLIGFDGNKEFLPNDFDEFNSITKLRQLFLNLSNNIFKCSCQFSKYEIRSIPTILYFKDGKIVDQTIGATTKAKIEEKLNRLI